jgi:hypothetical protein
MDTVGAVGGDRIDDVVGDRLTGVCMQCEQLAIGAGEHAADLLEIRIRTVIAPELSDPSDTVAPQPAREVMRGVREAVVGTGQSDRNDRSPIYGSHR